MPALSGSSRIYLPRFCPRITPSRPTTPSPDRFSPFEFPQSGNGLPLADTRGASTDMFRRIRARHPLGRVTPALPQSMSSSNMTLKTCPSVCSVASLGSHFMQQLKLGQWMHWNLGPTMDLPALPHSAQTTERCRTPRPLVAPRRAEGGARTCDTVPAPAARSDFASSAFAFSECCAIASRKALVCAVDSRADCLSKLRYLS